MSQGQAVNVSDLDLPQLAGLQKQLEAELNHLTNSFAQLKQAQAKFNACADSVSEIKPENEDKRILVPLTNSLYVPGRLSDPEHVIVDIGTGYYALMTRKQAQKYYLQTKVEYIRSNLGTLGETIDKKRENLSYLTSVMQAKIQEQTPARPAKK